MASARLLALSACLALAAAPALAQGRGAPRTQPPKTAAPEPPAIVPCRTAEEVCFLGVVVGSQLAVIFTNAANGEGIDAKPVDVAGPDGGRMDLSAHAGRVVMLAGAYDPKAGIAKAELVEVASPLVSLTVKAQLGGGEAPGKSPPPRRR